MSFSSPSYSFFFKILSTSPHNVSLVIIFKLLSLRVTSFISTRVNFMYWIMSCFGQPVLAVDNPLLYLACNLLTPIGLYCTDGHLLVAESTPIEYSHKYKWSHRLISPWLSPQSTSNKFGQLLNTIIFTILYHFNKIIKTSTNTSRH